MSERPSRLSKSRAINLIYNRQSDSSSSESGVEEDDVAFEREADHSEDEDPLCEGTADSDDDILNEDQIVSMSSDEFESSEDEEVNVPVSFISSNGTQWQNSSLSSGRESIANIFHGRRGFSPGIHPIDEKEAFLSIFHNLVNIVILNTNKSGRRFHKQSGQPWKTIEEDEIWHFLVCSTKIIQIFFTKYSAILTGIHFIAGALKAGHRNTRELWNDRDGIPLVRASMSENRFHQIKKHLRFDDKLRRIRDDPLAPVRNIVNQFNVDVNKVYRPGPFICVDEMLLEFHGRVRFRQYIPTKPGKFGIKVYWSVDAENSYPL